MANVLTTASSITCGPKGTDANPAHGGTISSLSTSKLKVSDEAVLIGVGPGVSGCKTTTSGSSSKQCTTATVVGGKASKLQVNGHPVMLDTVAGTLDGYPPTPGAISVDAKQGKLKAS
jgi:hypothetical protein